eukprot:6810831-Lingulodinium_polyedra.AAC.1
MGKKSTGLDGRRAAEVALLPDESLAVACELLDLVEREQYWPGVGPEGLLLPKPGADPAEALDRRPIWLLPV